MMCEHENDFDVSTEKYEKKDFLKKVKPLLAIAILLTAICSFVGIFGLVQGVLESVWREVGMAFFAQQEFFYLLMIVACVTLVKILVDEKPFSKTLTWSIRIMGVMFIASAVIFPRLSGFQSSGFDIFASGNFVLIDGKMLVPGILLIILGNLVMAGFDMQKEMDEIL